ncbi:MAG: class I SAM-dependent methyltransferase [Deltaproteobacteria bacterium]|nr:class I SAM-dependent methyltransferase [Deltaproteobacteria bacterium]
MSIIEKIQSQGGHPSGIIGTLIGHMMNMAHGNIYTWGLQDITIPMNATCLDIGCGGGKAVRTLAEKTVTGKVYGLDHSAEMIRLSGRTNHAFITKGIVEIHQGSISTLPYSDAYFDMVTAFETIQFWPNIPNNVMEIKRVLRPSGTFLIVNRYPPEQSKWSDFLQLKNAQAYENMLNAAGFHDITLDTATKTGWIKVAART